MDCHECKEKMLLYLDADNAGDNSYNTRACHPSTSSGQVGMPLQDFENHIKSCPSCAKEAAQLKESLRLVKDKEVFIPEVLETEQIERTEIELPQVIKNAVRQDAVRQDAVRAEYPVLRKEYTFKFAFPPLKFAYAMAIILCVGLGIYFIAFMTNNFSVAPSSPVAVKTTAVSSEKETAQTVTPPAVISQKNKAADKEKIAGAKPAPLVSFSPQKTAGPAEKKNIVPAQKEVLPEKTKPQEVTGMAAQEYKMSAAEPALDKKEALSAKNISLESEKEPVPAEVTGKIKKIVSEYKDVAFAAKKEGDSLVIFLFCPKEMKKEAIEELHNKLFSGLDIKKENLKITIILK